MKLTYKSNTMHFVIEVLDRQLTLTIYKQPSSIELGRSVPYRVGGIKFLSSFSVQIDDLFPHSDMPEYGTPDVFILGLVGSPDTDSYNCETTNEALIGASRLYHGLVGLDNLMGEV